MSNANTDYFRVTSLFGDPEPVRAPLGARHRLALALLAANRWRTWPLIGLIVVMWAGLLFSYSQSSMAALLLVTLALGLLTGDRRVRMAVGALAVAAALAAAAFVAVELIDGESLNHITSDRTEARGTRPGDRAQPAGGRRHRGPAARQPRAGRQRPPHAELRLAHDAMTVAAELGAIGVVLYVWLLAGGARLIELVRRRDQAVGLALAASFVALFVHALFYSGFLEDPITWLVLGSARAGSPGSRVTAPPPSGRASERSHERAARPGARGR